MPGEWKTEEQTDKGAIYTLAIGKFRLSIFKVFACRRADLPLCEQYTGPIFSGRIEPEMMITGSSFNFNDCENELRQLALDAFKGAIKDLEG